MKILAIETSCDETAIAILQIKGSIKKPQFEILANVVSSQIKIHAKYGGVVPHLAARQHQKNIIPVFETALKKGKIALVKKTPQLGFPYHFQPKIDYLAVTIGPGLIPALLMGVNFAKTLAWLTNRPLVGINHLEGHIYSNWIPPTKPPKQKTAKIEFPALVLIVSGGHTQLVLMDQIGKYQLVGETLDDAAGEAFDKVAKMLGLGYPGGPIISKLAEEGNPEAFAFPRPMINSANLNFSFAGLKTAVLYTLKDLGFARQTSKPLPQKLIADFCASFQEAVVEVLVAKTKKAAEKFRVKTVMVSGGVAANKRLRQKITKEVSTPSLGKPKIFFPKPKLSTDNAAMIASAAFFKIKIKGKSQVWPWQKINAYPNLAIKSFV